MLVGIINAWFIPGKFNKKAVRFEEAAFGNLALLTALQPVNLKSISLKPISLKPMDKRRLSLWLLDDMRKPRPPIRQSHQDHWWKVMCLTGLDYFSSLGYAPGIAYLATGLLSPVATVILVLLTLFGALPVYCRVASRSPHGQGSIAMLEKLFPGWNAKLIVLILLGFAATDFIITITLSAADAATHLIQNPWIQNPLAPVWLHNRMAITLTMLAILSGIFLKGFREAIGIAVVLVSTYLALNLIVVTDALYHLSSNWWMIGDWWHKLFVLHGSVWRMLSISFLFFPKLALGLSGFETGVAVMPLVKGDPDDNQKSPQGRIRNTKWLLRTAAVIMSFFLLGSAITTAILIPEQAFLPGGEANGRAIAYLAHHYLGPYFGTAYDISTILILWFAGASAMAGLLSLVPRYLPRYGMAPDWAKARRPLVVFFALVSFAVTFIFNASVDAQGSAYATGVLVLMTSAAIASFLTVLRGSFIQRTAFCFIAIVFCYTTVVNAFERPDGIKIASFFILIILATSFISRALRSTELRMRRIVLDSEAAAFINDACRGVLRLVAHRPDIDDYELKAKEATTTHNIAEEEIIFLEVKITDASDFNEEILKVSGEKVGRYRVLRCSSPAVPNALAAILLYLRDQTRHMPHLYLGWTEGNPLAYILRYLFLGEGETAPVTREILRTAEPDPSKRPLVHVG